MFLKRREVKRRRSVAAFIPRRRSAKNGGNMAQPRAADDFTAIRTRMEELRRERAQEPEQESRSMTGPKEEAEKRGVPRNLPGFSGGVRRRVG
jgi:hypothetical protein